MMAEFGTDTLAVKFSTKAVVQHLAAQVGGTTQTQYGFKTPIVLERTAATWRRQLSPFWSIGRSREESPTHHIYRPLRESATG